MSRQDRFRDYLKLAKLSINAPEKIKANVEVVEMESVKIYKMATIDFHNRPIMWVCAYLIDGLLIDCGHHNARKEFLKALDLNEIEKCVLSHHHEDHCGACYDLINKFNIPVYANKETAFLVRLKVKFNLEYHFTWGLHMPCTVKILPNLDLIKTKIAEFRIIPSPGHCTNLISLFHEKKRLLFPIDAFINDQHSILNNWENANMMLETFYRLKSLNSKLILLENGESMTSEGLEKLINYWNYIKEKSRELFDKNMNPRRIVKHIFGKEHWLKTVSGGDMSRENLIRSFLELPMQSNRKIYKK